MKDLIFLLIFIPVICSSQILRETQASSGSTQIINTGARKIIVQQSIGQQSVAGLNKSNFQKLRQGFIQPLLKSNIHRIPYRNLEVLLSPNPTESILNVHFSESIIDHLEIRIIDILGREVYYQNVDGLGEKIQRLNLDLGNLSAASYFISFELPGKRIIKKIIKI